MADLAVDDPRLAKLYERFLEMVDEVLLWNMNDPYHDASLDERQIVSLMLTAYRLGIEESEVSTDHVPTY